MISKIIMPDLGATGGPVTLMSWLVEPGEQVQAGQPLFLVETDKATVEVEAFRDGIVRQLLVEAGDTVPLGSVVAVVADSMEEALPAKPAEEAPSEPEAQWTQSTPVTSSISRMGSGRLLASPIARRMAEMEGINLLRIKGTGSQGQILKRDVEKAMTSARSKAEVEGEVRREPISKMRQAIARQTTRSKKEIPHFYADITVDMTQAMALRQKASEWAKKKGWATPTITDLCLRAAALTLGEFPMLNASFQDEEILYYQGINIGLVVGLAEGGMIVPVVHNADHLDLYKMAAITRRLRERAESGILGAAELSGGTFSLSNLGMFGLDSFTAVINPPQAAMLALGAVRELPAVYEGAIVPRPLMKTTLSVDHRLVDGIDAARFLVAWKDILEQPSRLIHEPSEESGR